METIGLNVDQVSKGVKTLFEYVKKRGDTQEELLNMPQHILLQVGFKKLPNVHNKVVKIVLPHSTQLQTSDVCLFVKDNSKLKRDFTPSVKHYKGLLQKHDIKQEIDIIPIKALKLEYKEYEAKRNLSNRYDTFLADDRIVRFLPRLLGKAFLGRKRFPVQIKLTSVDLQKEMDKALRTSHCVMGGRGSTCTTRVGHTQQDEEKAVDNLVAAIKRVAETIPGGPANIKSLHVKTELSPALPIYVSEGSAQDVDIPSRKRKVQLDEPEELTTIENGKVRVTPWGTVQVIKENKEPKAFRRKTKKPHSKQKALKTVKTTSQKKLLKKTGDKPSNQRLAKKKALKKDTLKLKQKKSKSI